MIPHRRVKNGFTQFQDGDEALMPEDSDTPFKFACGSLVLDLYFRTDDAGRIFMRVFRNEEETMRLKDTERRSDSRSFITDAGPLERAIISPTPRHYTDDDDPYDANGYLKDGRRIRVPLETMDSRRGAPVIINTGLRGKDSLDRFFDVDGSPKEPRRRRVRQRDPVGRESGSFEEEDACPHRPGLRTVNDAHVHQVTDARAEARDEMIRDLCNAWRPGPQPSLPPATTDDAGRPVGISDGEWERHRMIQEMTDAWRPRDS
jgi:hypothetical protein